MFCLKCGQPVEANTAFCKNCGAAVAAPDARSFTPPPPPPPRSGAGWQPPPEAQGPRGPQPPRGRAGLIVGIVIAVIIVLGGGGTAAYLLLGGDGEATTSSTQVALTSTTVADVTTTTTAMETSTSQTVPDLGTSTTGTSDPNQSLQIYLTATDSMAQLLMDDDSRIPELAVTINNTAPDVPRAAWEELQKMMGELDAGFTSLGEISVPSDFVESNAWLNEAAMAMGNRIDATINGIEAMWDAGKVSAGATFFDLGRQARDDYRASFEKFQNSVPID
jgi:hypothetical protein